MCKEEEEHSLSPNSSYTHLMSFICIISSPKNAGGGKKGLGRQGKKSQPHLYMQTNNRQNIPSRPQWVWLGSRHNPQHSLARSSGNSRSPHRQKRKYQKSCTILSTMWIQTQCLMYLWWCSTVGKAFLFLFTLSIRFWFSLRGKAVTNSSSN